MHLDRYVAPTPVNIHSAEHSSYEDTSLASSTCIHSRGKSTYFVCLCKYMCMLNVGSKLCKLQAFLWASLGQQGDSYAFVCSSPKGGNKDFLNL